MIAQATAGTITIGGVVVLVVGAYIALGKHTGNSEKHPKVDAMVTEKSCTDRTRRIEESINAESKLADERHTNLAGQITEMKENTNRIFGLLEKIARN